MIPAGLSPFVAPKVLRNALGVQFGEPEARNEEIVFNSLITSASSVLMLHRGQPRKNRNKCYQLGMRGRFVTACIEGNLNTESSD